MNDNMVLDDKVFEQLKMGDMTDQEKKNFSQVFFDALDTRVNQRLVDKMNPEQQSQYLKLIGDGNEKAIEDFKVKTFSNLRSIVDEEFEKLKADISSGAEQLTDEQANQTLSEPAVQPVESNSANNNQT